MSTDSLFGDLELKERRVQEFGARGDPQSLFYMEDEYSLSSVRFQREQVESCGVRTCSTLTSDGGGFLVVFSSPWNCHGRGGVIFYCASEVVMYLEVTSASTPLPCWNEPVWASL